MENKHISGDYSKISIMYTYGYTLSNFVRSNGAYDTPALRALWFYLKNTKRLEVALKREIGAIAKKRIKMRYISYSELVYLYNEAKNYLAIMLDSNQHSSLEIKQQCDIIVFYYNLKNEYFVNSKIAYWQLTANEL